MVEVKPIGTVYQTDSRGNLISQSSRDNIQSELWPVLDRVVEIYQEVLGSKLHSVYVRGTVSRGQAIPGISDIDTFAILKEHTSMDFDTDPWKPFYLELQALAPGFNDIDFEVWSWEKLSKPGRRLLLKVQSAWLWGEDLTLTMSPVSIDRELVSGLSMNIDQLISEASERIQISDNPETWIKWITKAILRTGCVLVMEREQAFTRDLYPCWELFAKYYSDQADQMYQALVWYLNPEIVSKEEMISYLDTFGNWLAEERHRIA